MQTASNKLILAGLATAIGWRFLSPSQRRGLLRSADELLNAMVQQAVRERALQQLQLQQELQLEMRPATPVGLFAEAEPISPVQPAIPLRLPPEPRGNALMEGARAAEPDRRWLEVVVPPAVILIVGKRGSGKSALAYRLLELFRSRLTPYVVGVPAQARRLIPEWIGIAPRLEDVPHHAIAIIDEAYVAYHARGSMAQESREMSQMLNLSRQRDQTLLFVTQEARQVDKNIASSATVLVFKDLGMLQVAFDRPELRTLVVQAREALDGKPDKRPWSYVYSPDTDFLGLLENQLASFWKPSLSTMFAAAIGPSASSPRRAQRMTSQEKAVKAMELRSRGLSYAEIARELGVAKSTVVNYLRDYPYRHPAA